MNNSLNKSLVQDLLKSEGQVRGAVFQTDKHYVLQTKGQEGLEQLKKRAKELDCEVPYETADAMKWYPLGLRVVSLLLIKDVFGWSDSDIEEMGKNAPKKSFIVRLLMRWLVSFKELVKRTPEIWKKHYNKAEIEIVSVDLNKKEDIIRLKGAKIHPVLCHYLTGYFLTMHRYVVGTKGENEHIKCLFRGDDSCDFKQWVRE